MDRWVINASASAISRSERSTALSSLEHISIKARILKALPTEATKHLDKRWRKQASINTSKMAKHIDQDMTAYEDHPARLSQSNDAKESLLREFLEKRFAHLRETHQSSQFSVLMKRRGSIKPLSK